MDTVTALNAKPGNTVWEFIDFDWGCNCNAEEFQLHDDYCLITPFFAQLCCEINSIQNLHRDFVTVAMSITQTVIKCAECGRELLARDADVIYKQPIRKWTRLDNLWKRPKNIVKAVCSQHNRKGRVGYQQPTSAGY